MVQSIFPREAVKYVHRFVSIDIVNKIVHGTATDEQYYNFCDVLEEYGEEHGLPEGWWMNYSDDETVWAREVRSYVADLNADCISCVEFNHRTETLTFVYGEFTDKEQHFAVTGEFAHDDANNCFTHDIEMGGKTIRIYFE